MCKQVDASGNALRLILAVCTLGGVCTYIRVRVRACVCRAGYQRVGWGGTLGRLRPGASSKGGWDPGAATGHIRMCIYVFAANGLSSC